MEFSFCYRFWITIVYLAVILPLPLGFMWATVVYFCKSRVQNFLFTNKTDHGAYMYSSTVARAHSILGCLAFTLITVKYTKIIESECSIARYAKQYADIDSLRECCASLPMGFVMRSVCCDSFQPQLPVWNGSCIL